MRYLLILLMSFLAEGCCNFVSKSEWIKYRGRVVSREGKDSIEVFSAHGGWSVLDGNGNISPQLAPVLPDSGGFFIVGATSPSHNDCDTPDHSEGGPLEIFIRGATIQNFHDTLSKEELKSLPQLNPDSVGVKLGSDDLGIWQLPDITLVPR